MYIYIYIYIFYQTEYSLYTNKKDYKIYIHICKHVYIHTYIYIYTKEFIMKEKLTKERVGFLCILEMTSPIKFETIGVLLIAIEKFSQMNYSQKA